MDNKTIYIKKENCDFERLFETLELETGVTSITRRRPTEMHLGGAEILGCDDGDNNGLCWCEHEGRTEIYCEADFVAEVKRRYPKKEETYCVNVEFLNWSKFAARVENVSCVKVGGACESPSQFSMRHIIANFLTLFNSQLLFSSNTEQCTQVTPKEFIAKCAELCPKKSIYDELEPDDLCFVSDIPNEWFVMRYAGNKRFRGTNNTLKWKNVIPLGKNVRDYPELEASDGTESK